MKDEKIEKVPSSQNLKSDQNQNFEFVENSNGTLKIQKYLGNDIDVTIPSEYNGKKVTMVGEKAFRATEISSITIPSSIKKIEDNPFLSCFELKEIKVDSNNTTYDSRNNCNAIIETETNTLISGCKNTNIPKDIKKIGYYAFKYCSNLSQVTLNEGLEKIGLSAFEGTKIKSIVIPSSVKEIDDSAFSNCSNLSQVTLNEGLEKIGSSAFQGTKIKSIVIPSSVKEIDNSAFYECSNLSQVTLNEGLEKIGWDAFWWTKISSITIPSSVKEITTILPFDSSHLKKVICKVPKDKITWKWSDLKIDESIVKYA